MSNYRRIRTPGGWFFFTVVTKNRKPWLVDPSAMQRLRHAFREVVRKRPFAMDAIVILPDHLHAIWRLPPNDSDFSTRWRLLKHLVSTAPGEEWKWQPRFWEHMLRDENDWRKHVEYIHYNPVKHGYVQSPRDWPFSSFHRAVRRGWHESSWCSTPPVDWPTDTGE